MTTIYKYVSRPLRHAPQNGLPVRSDELGVAPRNYRLVDIKPKDYNPPVDAPPLERVWVPRENSGNWKPLGPMTFAWVRIDAGGQVADIHGKRTGK